MTDELDELEDITEEEGVGRVFRTNYTAVD